MSLNVAYSGTSLNAATLAAILAYCRANNRPMNIIHTPPASTIGGFSCWLIAIDGDSALIEIANGDRETVSLSEITVQLEY